MSSRIDLYIGSGENSGVSAWCAEIMKSSLEKVIDARIHQIREITSLETWLATDLKSVKALVIPGGNAAFMLYDLKSNEDLKLLEMSKLFQKVSYYGSCAGAILAGSKLYQPAPKKCLDQFGINTYNAKHDSYLNWFPGSALAPLSSNTVPDEFSEKKIVLRNIKTFSGNESKTIQTTHLLGPGFLNSNIIPRTEVLATYDEFDTYNMTSFSAKDNCWYFNEVIDTQMVAESLFYKQTEESPGMILAGSHPEITSQDILKYSTRDAFKLTEKQQAKLSQLMKDGDNDREVFFKQNLNKIGISTIS